MKPSIKQRLFDVEDTGRARFWERTALTNNKRAAVIYLAIAFIPLMGYLCFAPQTKLDFWCMGVGWRLLFLALGAIVSVGPPAWFWIEARAFDDWVSRKRKRAETSRAESTTTAPNDTPINAESSKYVETLEQEERRLRETFKLNADSEKAFWAAIVAVYAAVLLKF